jgi:hypothetical protein
MFKTLLVFLLILNFQQEESPIEEENEEEEMVAGARIGSVFKLRKTVASK